MFGNCEIYESIWLWDTRQLSTMIWLCIHDISTCWALSKTFVGIKKDWMDLWNIDNVGDHWFWRPKNSGPWGNFSWLPSKSTHVQHIFCCTLPPCLLLLLHNLLGGRLNSTHGHCSQISSCIPEQSIAVDIHSHIKKISYCSTIPQRLSIWWLYIVTSVLGSVCVYCVCICNLRICSGMFLKTGSCLKPPLFPWWHLKSANIQQSCLTKPMSKWHSFTRENTQVPLFLEYYWPL